MFFCHTCLIDRPLKEVSPDPRYCKYCYEFLLSEWKLMSHLRKPPWVPAQDAVNKLIRVKSEGVETPHVVQGVRVILSTVKGNNSEVDKKESRPPIGIKTETRGRKQTNLPHDFIKRLASKGLGSKGIAARLKVEHGINCSYRTVARVLKGERN